MPRFHYFQTNEKGPWHPVEDKKGLDDYLIEQGAKKRTILSLSSPIGDDTDLQRVTYQGPFYIDIDSDSSDIAASIEAARKMNIRLKHLELREDSYAIYCSGAKGFHFIVHEKTFGDGKPVAYLPYVYKLMATDLYVPGLDFSPYSGGKGNTFRIPNVQRDDGRYRVRISGTQLDEITPELYVQLTSSPQDDSHLPAFPPETKFTAISNDLSRIYQSALKRNAEDQRSKQVIAVDDEDLKPFSKDPPQCVRDLLEGKRNHARNFNNVALQLAFYNVRAGVEHTQAESYIELLAANGDSGKYTTSFDRANHIRGLCHFVSNTPDKKFSCNAMRATLSTRPCAGCVLEEKYSSDANEEGEADCSETAAGYQVRQGRKMVLVTNFILQLDTKLVSIESGKAERQACICTVIVANEFYGQVQIPEAAWSSRSMWINLFNGISNCSFFGVDRDLQKIKQLLLKEEDGTNEIITAHSVGIHLEPGSDTYAWVEPERSINSAGVEGTFELTIPRQQVFEGWVPLLPQRVPEHWDTQRDVLQCMYYMNEPQITVPVLGWLAACHLKTHIMALQPEFPLINLYGPRGSAKTVTAALFSAINGCDYYRYAPWVAQSSTVWGIKSVLSQTTTVPVLLDEVNREVFQDSRKEELADVLKGVWNAQNMARGTLKGVGSRGSVPIAEHTKLTAPLMMLSETRLDSHALVDRCVVVAMNTLWLRGKEEQKQYVHQNYRAMFPFARALMLRAVRMKPVWVEAKIEEWRKRLPMFSADEIRPHYSRAIIGLGLDFLRDTCRLLGFGNEPLLDQMIAQYLDIYGTESEVEKIQHIARRESECDTFLREALDYLRYSKAAGNSMFPSFFLFNPERTLIRIQVHNVCTELVTRNKVKLRLRADEYAEQLQQDAAYRRVDASSPGFGDSTQVWLDIQTLRERGHKVPDA